MVGAIFNFIGSMLDVVLVVIIVAICFFVIIGFMSVKGSLGNLRRGRGFFNGRGRDHDDYDRYSNNSRRGRYDSYRNRDRDRRSRGNYMDFGVPDRFYKSRQQDEDMNYMATQNDIVDMTRDILDDFKATVCTKEDLNDAIKEILNTNKDKLKNKSYEILDKGINNGLKEVYMVVQGKDFKLNKVFGTKNPREFLESVDINLPDGFNIIKTTVSKLAKSSDITICRFKYVSKQKTNMTDLAEDLEENRMTKQVFNEIQDSENEDLENTLDNNTDLEDTLGEIVLDKITSKEIE